MTFKKILIPVLLFAVLINIRAAEEKYGKKITIKEKVYQINCLGAVIK